MTDTKVVSFSETPIINVRRFLRKEYPNIAFAGVDGMSYQSLSEDTEDTAIGLLDADSAPQLGRLQRIFQHSRRRFMGVLWLSNEAHSKWILDLYGDQDIDFLTEVVEKITQEFDVSVHLKLVSEEPRYERFLSDYRLI